MPSFPEAVAEVSLKIGGSPGFPREPSTTEGTLLPWRLVASPQTGCPRMGWGHPAAGDHRGKWQQVGGGREGDPEVGAQPGAVQGSVRSHPCPGSAGRWELMSRDASCGVC